MQCYATRCLELRSQLSQPQKMEKYCDHLKQAEDARVNDVKAKEYEVKDAKLSTFKLDESELNTYKAASSGGSITTYILPGNNVVVPSMMKRSHDNPCEFLHIRNLQCPLQACKDKKKTKVRTLIKKDKPLCLHTLLADCTKLLEAETIAEETNPGEATSAKASTRPKPGPKIDRDSTAKYIHDKIKEHLPTMSSQGASDFLVNNYNFTRGLLLNQNISEVINQTIPSECKFCEDSELIPWPFKAKNAFFLSMGHFREISIEVKTCEKCKVAYYPELYQEGLLPIHNKYILSFDLIMDFHNLQVTGSSLVENIEEKFLLLGKCNGFEENNLRTNLSNHTKNIEKYVIAATASLG